MKIDMAPIYTARGVLDAIARVLGCATKDVEIELEKMFEIEIPSHSKFGERLDAIRKIPMFNPGEGNNIVDHIYELVKHEK